MKIINSLVYDLDSGGVVIRHIYTLIFGLYLLKIISWGVLKYISTKLFLILIVALFGKIIGCWYFEVLNKSCKKMYGVQLDVLREKNMTDTEIRLLEIIRIIYKLLIFILVLKYITPEFTLVNIIVPILIMIIYLSYFPIDISHFGKKYDYSNNDLNGVLIISGVIIFFIISKLY